MINMRCGDKLILGGTIKSHIQVTSHDSNTSWEKNIYYKTTLVLIFNNTCDNAYIVKYQ